MHLESDEAFGCFVVIEIGGVHAVQPDADIVADRFNTVFVPICLLTCSALGANPTGLVLLVNAGSLTAFLTPMATPAVPMCMADGGYDLRAIFKSGALITLILPFIYIFYTMTVFPAF